MTERIVDLRQALAEEKSNTRSRFEADIDYLRKNQRAIIECFNQYNPFIKTVLEDIARELRRVEFKTTVWANLVFNQRDQEIFRDPYRWWISYCQGISQEEFKERIRKNSSRHIDWGLSWRREINNDSQDWPKWLAWLQEKEVRDHRQINLYLHLSPNQLEVSQGPRENHPRLWSQSLGFIPMTQQGLEKNLVPRIIQAIKTPPPKGRISSGGSFGGSIGCGPCSCGHGGCSH